MPYIKSNDGRREALQRGEPAQSAGELNYQIFYYVKHNYDEYKDKSLNYTFIERFINQFLGEKPNYQKYNDMTGCLIRCAKELERRLNLNAIMLYEIMDSYDEEINKYEDTKIESNGDVG